MDRVRSCHPQPINRRRPTSQRWTSPEISASTKCYSESASTEAPRRGLGDRWAPRCRRAACLRSGAVSGLCPNLPGPASRAHGLPATARTGRLAGHGSDALVPESRRWRAAFRPLVPLRRRAVICAQRGIPAGLDVRGLHVCSTVTTAAFQATRLDRLGTCRPLPRQADSETLDRHPVVSRSPSSNAERERTRAPSLHG